jgi:hypothetical protein
VFKDLDPFPAVGGAIDLEPRDCPPDADFRLGITAFVKDEERDGRVGI